MEPDSTVIATILRRSIVSVMFCLFLGFIFYQWFIFDLRSSSFQITAFGIMGSVFFFTLRVHRRNAFAVMLVMFVLEIGLFWKSHQVDWIVGNLIFVASIAAAEYYFFARFYLGTIKLRFLHPLVLGALFVLAIGLATSCMTLFEIIVHGPLRWSFLPVLELNTRNGMLVGLGIGLGILCIDNGYVRWTGQALRRVLGSLGASFREFGERI